MKYFNSLFVIVCTVFLLSSCNTKKTNAKDSVTPHPNYVEISGKITNATSSEILIWGMGKSDIISINADGTFKDTIVAKNGRQQIYLKKDSINAPAYFENGDNIYFTADASDFKNTVKFEQDNASYNNYLSSKDILMRSELGFNKSWYRDSEEVFSGKVDALKAAFSKLFESYPDLRDQFVTYEKDYNKSFIERFSAKYKTENSFAVKLKKGNTSPIFKDYENVDGSKTSLSDFKGKYVFIDVWATWCVPCKVQFPLIKELEEEYKNKNIAFVGVSVDFQKDHDKWKTMVTDKKLSGTQILAPKAFKSEFIEAYNIKSIPRFILIDPAGNIVDFNAPKPSRKEDIKTLFSSINI